MIVVIRITTDDAAQRNDGGILSTFGKLPSHNGDLEGTRNANHIPLVGLHAVAGEGIDHTGKKLIDDERIEPGRDDGKAACGCAKIAFVGHGRSFRGSVGML